MHDFLMSGKSTAKMPILFLGHGSPMNAIEENEFVKNFRKLSASIPKPKAILCISAHWETKGTKITAMENPTTIHDFGGFPRALFEVQYPAPGSPALAQHIHETIEHTPILLDNHWGLDHGSWSVIKHMYPDAEVPVLELSLDIRKSAYEHYELAKQLQALRTKGVLIIGSGNMVHNLGMLAWNKLEGEPYAYDWALEANEKMKNFILNDRHSELLNYKNQGKAFDLSIPTPEHYLPLLYTLGLTQSTDEPFIFNDQPVGGSLTMTSVQWG
jgi:4,5-DOPA dioxygenase extradiol